THEDARRTVTRPSRGDVRDGGAAPPDRSAVRPRRDTGSNPAHTTPCGLRRLRTVGVPRHPWRRRPNARTMPSAPPMPVPRTETAAPAGDRAATPDPRSAAGRVPASAAELRAELRRVEAELDAVLGKVDADLLAPSDAA